MVSSFSILCFSIQTSTTPLLRLKFPGGGRLSSSLRAHNGITADDAHLFLDVSICLRGFFFPPSKRLKKLSLLVTAVEGSLKHYGGSDQLQRLVGTRSGLCPWLGTLPQLKKCGGCPKFPSEDRAPSPDTPDRFSPTDASWAPETSAHNEAHTCKECKSWGSAQGGRSAGGRQQIPG